VTDYPVERGLLRRIDGWIAPQESDGLYAWLLHELAWHEESIRLFGCQLKVPRLVAWYGNEGARYRYSGVDHHPLPWTPCLLSLKQRLEAYCGRRFNSVLANHYRTGQDSMGWHSDDEPELGSEPWIASLSLGAERRFKLRHRSRPGTLDIPLGNGSLLLMGGALQQDYQHCVPKTRVAVAGRINLTFRLIRPGCDPVRPD
jgi:alkylated DNA repair dioxygenase AlkB